MAGLLVILPLILIAAPAHVKDGDARHLRAAQGQEVFVIDSVRRVDANGDRIRDGFIKGVAFGAFIGLITSEYIGARAIPQVMLVYGAIGAGLDAINRCKQTVYRAPAPQIAATVSW